MSFMEEFEACLESLPTLLQRKYGVIHDLDKSLAESQRQNELRCEQEIAEIERGIRSGSLLPDASVIRFSDEALDEQKHCVGIGDEKVAVAVKAYDMVDAYIQVLDQYLRRAEEARRQENDVAAAAAAAAAAAVGVSDPSFDGNVKPEKGNVSSKAGRNKKTRLAVTPEVPLMDLDLPVDPNEPTYCFCNQVSYGEMVACDNSTCKIEWFHFACVGLREHPKGKWYCADCAGLKPRRKGK